MSKKYVIHCPPIVFDDFNAIVARLPADQAQGASEAADMLMRLFRDDAGNPPKVNLRGAPRVLLNAAAAKIEYGGATIDFLLDTTLDPGQVVVLSITFDQ